MKKLLIATLFVSTSLIPTFISAQSKDWTELLSYIDNLRQFGNQGVTSRICDTLKIETGNKTELMKFIK